MKKTIPHIKTRIIKSYHGYNSKYKIIMDDGRYNFAIVSYNAPEGCLYIKMPGIPATRLFYHLQNRKRQFTEYEDEFSLDSVNTAGTIHTQIKKLFIFEHRLTLIQFDKALYHLYTIYTPFIHQIKPYSIVFINAMKITMRFYVGLWKKAAIRTMAMSTILLKRTIFIVPF